MAESREIWLRTEAIFHEAAGLLEPERTRVLESRCAGDTTLMAELRSLLDACEREQTQATAVSETTLPPLMIGPYSVDHLIGRGGMGAVYLAHRADGQFDQRVAIKVIDMPLSTHLFRERFRNERQILAGLSHPYIARLLDGGVSVEGELYLAMEYIDGVSITRFCEDGKLSIAQRLILFRKVCEAVQYAHQNLIVHRDLKPDNILVVDDGTPRLLDFGTAKILSPLTNDVISDATRRGMQTFTPRFASPEQVLGQAITVASDIYSLGVLLFVLLTGRQPYELFDYTTEEMVRVIAGEQPARPSAGSMPFGRLDAELDSVVLKALRKEPEQRYSTVQQFGADIDAYLEQRPVLAQRGNFQYRARKFARRNRLGIAAALVLGGTLAAGVAGIMWQSHKATTEQHKAEARSTDIRQLSSSLLSELDDAIKQLPGSTSVQQLLVKRVLEHIDRMALDEPDDRLAQLDVVDAYTRLGNLQGNPYDQNIGDAAGALASLDKAVRIAQRFSQQKTPDTEALHAFAYAQQSRGEVLFGLGRTLEALSSTRAAANAFDALAASPTATSLQMSEAATVAGSLGDQLGQAGTNGLDRTTEALAAFRQAVALQQRALEIDPQSARARRGLPIMLTKISDVLFQTDAWESTRLLRHALQQMSSFPAQEQSTYTFRRSQAYLQRKLAVALAETGEYDQALSFFESARSINAAFSAADPKNARDQTDLCVVDENEAGFYESMLDSPVLSSGQRERYRRIALDRLNEALILNNFVLNLHPEQTAERATLADLRRRIGTLLQATPNRTQGAALSRQGMVDFNQIMKSSKLPGHIVDTYVNALLHVEPASLRDPESAIVFAKQNVDATHATKPLYLWSLAMAYDAAGKHAEALECAREGIALLAPVRPGERSTVTRKSFEALQTTASFAKHSLSLQNVCR